MSTINPGQYPQPIAPAAIPVAPPAAPVPVTPAAPAHQHHDTTVPELRIYSHSSFFYWWPVWLAGLVMALLTWTQGTQVQIGAHTEWFHPSKNLGVIYTAVFFFVILVTNVTVRGLASVVTILTILFLTVLFAYLGWWEYILSWLPHLSVHMNLGFYVLFSTAMLLVWAFAIFVHDRMSYWVVRPGQLTHDYVIGGAQKSYDTRGMVFEKLRQDFFRQWILGLGSGDIHIATTGARREEIVIPNVLFVDWKVTQIQNLIAQRPEVEERPAT
jgi:hypothetical protein